MSPVTVVPITWRLSARTLRCASRRILGTAWIERASSSSSAEMASCTFFCFASDRAWNSSGLITLSLCIGAKPKPPGVRTSAMPWPRAFSPTDSISFSCCCSNSPSISCSRVRYSSVSKAPGMPVRRSSTSRWRSSRKRGALPAGSSSAFGLSGAAKLKT